MGPFALILSSFCQYLNHRGPKRKRSFVCRTWGSLMSVIRPTPLYYVTLRLYYVSAVIFSMVECGIARFLCAMRVFQVRASSSPRGYFRAKFRFFRDLLDGLAHGEKSRTQSITQLI